MTWEIIVGLITLVGFVVSIGKIVSNNTRAMTEVKVGLDDLKGVISETKIDLNKVKDNVSKHETRITVLEHTK